jgi:hypothetical protein
MNIAELIAVLQKSAPPDATVAFIDCEIIVSVGFEKHCSIDDSGTVVDKRPEHVKQADTIERMGRLLKEARDAGLPGALSKRIDAELRGEGQP